jgi:hypothetical protein
MPLLVRPEAPEAARDGVVELFRRHLNPAYDLARFDWLYLNSPHGPGRLWVAREGAGGGVVGAAGAFPRPMREGGRRLAGIVLGDFCLAPAYRSLGPALALQRACLAGAREERADVVFDFPSPAMEAVYRRLGVGRSYRLRRLVRVLRSGALLATALPPGALARGLTAVGDLLLAALARPVPGDGFDVEATVSTACSPELDALAEAASPAWGLCVERSAAHVDWRYLRSPVEPHHLLLARRAGRLAGYAVITARRDRAAVVDLFGLPDPGVFEALLAAAVGHARRAGAEVVSLWLPDDSTWARRARGAGFRPRESAAVVICPGRPDLPLTPAAWCLMAGDRDS